MRIVKLPDPWGTNEVKPSGLEDIRALKAWRVATVTLALLIYSMLLVLATTLLVVGWPTLPLEPLFVAELIVVALLVLVLWICVALLTPYTSRFTGVRSRRPDLARFRELFTLLFKDLWSALRCRWPGNQS
jgi:hypothetical protein